MALSIDMTAALNSGASISHDDMNLGCLGYKYDSSGKSYSKSGKEVVDQAIETSVDSTPNTKNVNKYRNAIGDGDAGTGDVASTGNYDYNEGSSVSKKEVSGDTYEKYTDKVKGNSYISPLSKSFESYKSTTNPLYIRSE